MIVGASIDPRAYTARVPALPESRMCRVFGYASKGMPTWRPQTGDRRVSTLCEMLPAIVPALVFQDWPDDAEVKRRLSVLLDEADRPFRLTWRHEADRKHEPVEQYRRRYFLIQAWLGEHPNGYLATLVPTSTYQWTTSNAAGKGRGDWSLYHVGIGTPGVDTYANSWESGYPHVPKFLEPLWRYRDVINDDIEIPEFGAARARADVNGNGRAEFITAVADGLAAGGVTAVSYWDDIGSNGTDLRLWFDKPDTPELAAWRDVMRRYNTPAV